MKAQRNERSAPEGRKGRHVKLLFVGRDSEFEGNATRRIFRGDRLWITEKSASLLGALERLRSGAIDLVLLGHEFRDEELALFVADARRGGFEGLILRVASTRAFGADASGDASPAGLSSKGHLDDSLKPIHTPQGMQPHGERWGTSLSARQRAVLARVSEGWSNQEVARHLNCTEGAVKATLQELFRKLGVRKRAQIVRMVLEKELIDPGEKPAGPSYGGSESAHPFTPRMEPQSKAPIHIGDFFIDIAMHRVSVRGVEIHLTPREFELLAVFAMHPGELMRGSSLREMFWRNPTARQDVLRVLVGALRAKIEVSRIPRYVVTERNLGYRFIPWSEGSAAAEDKVAGRKPTTHRGGEGHRTLKPRAGRAPRFVPARSSARAPGGAGGS